MRVHGRGSTQARKLVGAKDLDGMDWAKRVQGQGARRTRMCVPTHPHATGTTRRCPDHVHAQMRPLMAHTDPQMRAVQGTQDAGRVGPESCMGKGFGGGARRQGKWCKEAGTLLENGSQAALRKGSVGASRRCAARNSPLTCARGARHAPG